MLMVSGEDDEPSRPSGYYCWDDLRLEITNEINSVDSCELKIEIMSCDSIHFISGGRRKSSRFSWRLLNQWVFWILVTGWLICYFLRLSKPLVGWCWVFWWNVLAQNEFLGHLWIMTHRQGLGLSICSWQGRFPGSWQARQGCCKWNYQRTTKQ